MAIEVDTNGLMRETGVGPVIMFRDPNTGQESHAFIKENTKKIPGSPHTEGDRYVEVSIEAFAELMALIGYFPVDPGSNAIVIPDELLADNNEEYASEQEETDE